MVDMVLVKKDILRYVQNVRTVRRTRRGLPDHHVVLCKVRLIEFAEKDCGECCMNVELMGT